LTPYGSPLVSVVIPSRNSQDTIADCLSSVISQLHRPIEIIVVDSFSTDSTVEIARAMGANVMLHDNGRSAQKNWGAKFASGEYLYFVDADFKLEPSVIAACLEAIGSADGVVIRNQDIARDSKVSQLIASRRRILSYDPLNVAVRFVRREIFYSVGGYDPDLYADEDVDFQRRFLNLGFKMVYSRVTELHSSSPVDLKGLLNRSLYYSSNHLRYASRNPLDSFRRINPLRVVAAWKRSGTPSSDLLPVVLLGFLSNAFLMIGVLLNLNGREGTRKETHDC
jgi:glycosyltransferase involved in cell wall biosynthesis